MKFLTDSDAARLNESLEDNQASAFFHQQLTLIMTRMFMVQHKAIRYREMFNINNDGDAGVMAITMFVWDLVGSAKIIGHFSDDLPAAGAGGQEVTVPVRWIGDSFHISWMELQQAQRAGTNLNAMRAMAANRAIEIKLNNIAWGIDEEGTDAGIYGLMSNPNVPASPVVAGGTSGNVDWAGKTVDEILLDINNAFSTPMEATFGAHRPNKLALPIAQYNLIATTRISALTTETILQHLVANSVWISSADDIVVHPELAGAGAGGTDVMMVWEDTADNSEFYIPYEKDTPVGTLVDGIAFKTPVLASTGGLDVRYPLAFFKGEGI